jgi:hypothetical protein
MERYKTLGLGNTLAIKDPTLRDQNTGSEKPRKNEISFGTMPLVLDSMI